MTRIGVLAFSPVHRDARVLRQAEALATRHSVLAIGYGPQPESFARRGIDWISLGDEPRPRPRPSGTWKRAIHSVTTRARLLLRIGAGIAARLWPRLHIWIFWRVSARRDALEQLLEGEVDAVSANDWDALAVAAEVSERTGARVVFDAHEYAPLQFENRRWWSLVDAPHRRYILSRYAPSIDASTTVSPVIAERLAAEYGLRPELVLSAPAPSGTPADTTHLQVLKLVHHGAASPGREPERMIQAVASCGGRVNLEFILVGDVSYIEHLKARARDLAPHDISFRDPVPPDEIVATLAGYDMGIFVLPSNTFNHRAALPNKLFDFIGAGLAVCIGPSEAMAEIVRRYDCGVITHSFEPEDVADALMAVDLPRLRLMQAGSRRASADDLNAQHQMAKMLDVFEGSFAGVEPPPTVG
jgi:glycosyltransferase involved in cell wall biosynthesis